MPEDALHFCGRRHNFRLQIARNLLKRLDHVAVVVNRVDDCGADAHFALVQPGHLELPRQMLLQRFSARVREILRLIVAAGPRRLRRASDLRIAPLRIVDQVDVGSGLFAIGLIARIGRRCARGGGFKLRLDDIAAFGTARFVFGLEHDVRLERLTNLGLKFEHRKLEQADRLLQLRRHRELLAES